METAQSALTFEERREKDQIEKGKVARLETGGRVEI